LLYNEIRVAYIVIGGEFMSWNAARYGKSEPNHHEDQPKKDRRQRRTASLRRTEDQQLIARLVEEKDGVIEGSVLENIFGSFSPRYALQVALRVKRAKRRDPSLPPPNLCDLAMPTNTSKLPRRRFRGKKKAARRRFLGRNRHHMTPRCRKEQLFSGNTRSNLLLIKISRHDFLHKEFGVRTWEEIIVLLARCANIACKLDFNTMTNRHISAATRRRSCRRMVRRSLRKVQLREAPNISGLFIY
jgi:hypothetical protein